MMRRPRGSSMAAEIRNAVDQYLSGATTEELEAMELLSKSAEKALGRMTRRLDQTNAKLDRVFKSIERLHKQKAAA